MSRHGCRIAAAALGLALFASAATGARAGPPRGDPEAVMVDELVVTSHTGGPAWWRVSSPTATVYVLGIPGALPKGLKWDQTLLKRRLDGATVLVARPIVTAGLGDVFALLKIRQHLRSRGAMEDSLPAPLRARFLADRGRLTSDRRAYSGWTPLVAGLLMVSDFRKQGRLDGTQPGAAIEGLARDKGVKVVPAGAYKAVPLFRAAEMGLTEAGPACLADALDEIEAGADRERAAAEGWAHGDVAAALSAQRGYEKCLNALPEGADLASKAMADTTAAIVAALARPGHAVAVVNLRTLLAQDGVLQRLKAQGYRISTPREAGA